MDKLDLTQCKTNSAVTKMIQSRVRSVTLEQVLADLSPDFVFCEETIISLYTALATGKNILLHGPGGFGKSTLVKAFCEYFGIPVICKIGYEDMQPEELFGVPNMQALLNDSKYEVAFENSVFSHPGILLLEEFMDCSPRTAAALKDILTEKGLREGNTKKESLISSVIICGNKDPESLAGDDSTKAFYKERFPIRRRVSWTEFTVTQYTTFLRSKFRTLYTDHENKEAILLLVARLAEATATQISPRIAKDAAEIALELGVAALKTVTDLDTSLLETMSRQAEQEAEYFTEEVLLEKVETELIEMINKIRLTTEVPLLLETRMKLRLIQEQLNVRSFSDNSFTRCAQLQNFIGTGEGLLESKLSTPVNINTVTNEVNQLFSPSTPSKL